jgi:putative effector of murein hydrolase LrgA (UPF0299 family)
MKTPSPIPLLGPAVLLAILFAAGSVAARVLDWPLPPFAVGLGLVLLALRIGAIVAAVREAPGPARARAAAHEPALNPARG